MDVGQAKIAALEEVGELLVIKAQEMQESCLEVVYMNFVLRDAETEFIGAAMSDAALDPPAGEEHGVAVGEMITTKHVTASRSAFAKRSSSKFAGPDD